MSDTVSFVLTILGFATWVTAHLAIAVGLVLRRPRWRGAVALLLPAPLAPYWAFREKMWFRAGAWVVGAIVYTIMRLVQRA